MVAFKVFVTGGGKKAFSYFRCYYQSVYDQIEVKEDV